jgi:hypothetical protein
MDASLSLMAEQVPPHNNSRLGSKMLPSNAKV